MSKIRAIEVAKNLSSTIEKLKKMGFGV